MRFTKHVSVFSDVTGYLDWVPVLAGFHSHLYPSPAGPVPVPLAPSVELPSVIGHAPGALTGAHKLTSTVYHRHWWIALDGHDLGPGIMHVCVPPPCIECPLDIIGSSRKAKFTAGEVKANGKAIACCTIFELCPPTPMLICGLLPNPQAGCGTSVAFSSLVVGMTWVDLIAGWVDTYLSIVQSVLCGQFKIGPGLPDFGSLGGGFVRLIGQVAFDYQGDAAAEYKPVSGLFGDVGTTITRDGATGDVTVERGARLQAGGLGGVQASQRYTRRASDGSVEEERSVGGSWLGGGERSETSRSTDGGHWERQEGTDNSSSLPWSEGTDVPFL